MEISQYIYGIDFGTSNSALSIIDTSNNQIVKTFSEKSLIFFPEPAKRERALSYYVGQEAIAMYVESRMKGRFMKSIKRILPRSSFLETRVYGKRYKAEDLVAIIIRNLKAQADAFLGQEISTAVLGRPVVFDEEEKKDKLAQDRLIKAATLAGFEKIAIQLEPIAAAFTYKREIDEKQLVLVADLGGGTSDFTLLQLNPISDTSTLPDFDFIGQGGIYIGGDNFDSAIMWKKGTHHFGRGLKYKDYDNLIEVPRSFYHNITSWEKMNFFDSLKLQSALDNYYHLTGNNPLFGNLVKLVRHNLGYSIFNSIVRSKMELSSKPLTNFHFNQEDINFSESISLAEFSTDIIGDDVEKIRLYLAGFLEGSGVKPIEVDTIFMTGGTSMVGAVRDAIGDLLGQKSMKSNDNFLSVANGLAYSYEEFFER